MNLAALVEGHPAEARALHDTSGWVSWGDLRRRAAAMAAELAARGVAPGDRVALALPTGIEFVAWYLAVLAQGAVAVPLNPNSPTAELAAEMGEVTPVVLVVGGSAAAAVPGPDLAGAVVVHQGQVRAGTAELVVTPRADDDLAVLLFTSGTAGAPKAAMLTHGNLRANLDQMLALPGEIARPDDVGLGSIPLFHVFGLNVSLGLMLATGGALVLTERFDPNSTLALVRDLGVTAIVGAPAMFGALVELPPGAGNGSEAQLSGVRRLISGAAPLAPETGAAFEARYGVTLWQGYGLTEAAPAVTTTLGTGRNRPGSVGRPLPGVEVRVVDEGGTDALAGDPGEIWVRGPNVFAGYWGDPEATAAVLTDDGWLRTGDVAVIGEDGDLYIVDRHKDLVIVSGFNVFPAEVEKVVRGVDGVADAVVVGKPDPVTGESVEVVVVARPGASVTEDQVRGACVASLARYKCPTSVRFVDELPRGLAGKALRRVLREQQSA